MTSPIAAIPPVPVVATASFSAVAMMTPPPLQSNFPIAINYALELHGLPLDVTYREVCVAFKFHCTPIWIIQIPPRCDHGSSWCVHFHASDFDAAVQAREVLHNKPWDTLSPQDCVIIATIVTPCNNGTEEEDLKFSNGNSSILVDVSGDVPVDIPEDARGDIPDLGNTAFIPTGMMTFNANQHPVNMGMSMGMSKQNYVNAPFALESLYPFQSLPPHQQHLYSTSMQFFPFTYPSLPLQQPHNLHMYSELPPHGLSTTPDVSDSVRESDSTSSSSQSQMPGGSTRLMQRFNAKQIGPFPPCDTLFLIGFDMREQSALIKEILGIDRVDVIDFLFREDRRGAPIGLVKLQNTDAASLVIKYFRKVPSDVRVSFARNSLGSRG